jgi:serine protease inhibitor
MYDLFATLSRLGEDLEKVGLVQTPYGLRVPAAGYSSRPKNQALHSSSNVEEFEAPSVLDSANKIFIASSFDNSLSPEARELFKEEVDVSRFETDADVELNRINTWVANVTRGKLQNMFSSNDVNGNTRMLLANAAYFKGQWLQRFPEEDTKKECFFLDPERLNAIEVPTMKLKNAKIGISTFLKCIFQPAVLLQ